MRRYTKESFVVVIFDKHQQTGAIVKPNSTKTKILSKLPMPPGVNVNKLDVSAMQTSSSEVCCRPFFEESNIQICLAFSSV